MKKKLSFTSVIIVLVLIVFPLVSYYYIRAGFEFYKDQMHELESKGSLSDILPGLDTLHEDMLEIWHLSCANCEGKDKYKEYKEFIEFADDFTGKEGMQFRSLSNTMDSVYFSDHPMLVRANWTFHHIEQLPLRFKVVESQIDRRDDHYFIIVDKDQNIRNAYSAAVQGDIGRLMTHTAMLMPKASRPTVDIIRETEK